MVLALAGVSMTGFAQDEVPTKKYSVATNHFGAIGSFKWVQIGMHGILVRNMVQI